MKATGIVRKVDELGRVTLPIELRRMLNMEIGDPIEFYVNGNQIVLKKYKPACIFCNHTDGISSFKGRKICVNCQKELKQLSD